MSQTFHLDRRNVDSGLREGRHLLATIGRWIWQHPWILLPLLALPALWPFHTLNLTGPSDAILHLGRLVLLDRYLQLGAWYPRWFPELFTGLGYPLLNFYGPFFYYVAEGLHLLGLDFVSALLGTAALGVILSGFSMYLLAREVLGRDQPWAALVAATAYMYAPYLLTNAYVRGAFAEVFAQVWLPLILWSARRLLLAARPQQYVLPLALTLGGLAVTHNITLLATPLVLVAYILVIYRQFGCRPARLGWMALAIAAAMGISAFFWLPALVESQLLARNAFQSAVTNMGDHFWTWRNFLDRTLAFEYTGEVPFQLGLVQLLLALAGLILARRRDAEWLFFCALAVLAGFGAGSWLARVWTTNEILSIAQFPWRLLIYMTPSLALFNGAVVVYLPRNALRVIGSAILMVVIVLANRPNLPWIQPILQAGESITLPGIIQFEKEKDVLGLGWDLEFMPIWTSPDGMPMASDMSAIDGAISLDSANAYFLNATISNRQEGPFRFASLYYPAWQVTTSEGDELPTYASTDLGLLTVDLPPGDVELTVEWTGTGLQHTATVISLLSLAALTAFVWHTNRPRWLAGVPLVLLLVGLAAFWHRPAIAKIQTPSRPISSPSLEFLGFQTEPGPSYEIYLYPFWYVRNTPPWDTLVRWQLRDEMGNTLSEIEAQPYFDSGDAGRWPPGTIVDDAYTLLLPYSAQEPPIVYQLAVQLVEGEETTDWEPAGTVTVTLPFPEQPQMQHLLGLRFGDTIELAGFDQRLSSNETLPLADEIPVLQPGDRMEITLYWKGLLPILEDYHAFIHLVDGNGTPVAKEDKMAGALFRRPKLWPLGVHQPDRYTIDIPENVASGLYWPLTGLYEFGNIELLPIVDASGQALGETFRLPVIKIRGDDPQADPEKVVDAQLGKVATLLGYDLTLPEGGLGPGSEFLLTLYFRSDTPVDVDYRRFAHLSDPTLGMAAQHDASPQNGNNPTWAWVPGEVVVDEVPMRIAEDAPAGDYALRVGLYDPQTLSRLEAVDRSGNPLANNEIVLTTLTIGQVPAPVE